ncbi:MAG TPA: murein biosynthesis integral membrane protein MurJ [Candidatus Parcubacteria bacterium]|nr:murein biosynthesis integral membrane protein MurJ [Candidatus Parcubacteria bacterium]
MLKRILNSKTRSISWASLILAVFTFFSALLGLLRDRLLAGSFGLSGELDIYYAAFRIPDFISMVLIMGAISAAIVPVFSQYLTRSKKEAWDFLANLFNIFLLILIIVLFFLFIFTPRLISFIAPGFNSEKRELTILLTRIMLLSPLLLGLSNIISAILQVFQRFFITSLAPIMYNLGIITGILFFAPRFGISGLAWGVVLGAFLHLSIQLPVLLDRGFRLQKIFRFFDPGFLKVIKLTIPRSIGLAANQINLIVVTAIASTLFTGSIAVFNLAQSLSRPFLTLIGVSFSTAAFPALSLAFAKKEKEKFENIFFSTFWRVFFLIAPLSLLLFLFRNLIVDIILRAGRFGQPEARLTAACLGVFALAVFAQSLILLLAKSFYSLHDTKTPALASIGGMTVNIILAFSLVKLFSFSNSLSRFFLNFFSLDNPLKVKIIALPLAVSFSALFQLALLLFFFYKRIKKMRQEREEINKV